MKLSQTAIQRTYGLMLYLYPPDFRNKYAAQLTDAVRHTHAESKDDLRFLSNLFWDTFTAAVREHCRVASTLSAGYVASFILLFSMLLLAVAVENQHRLRLGADDQPARLLALARAQLANGEDAHAFLPSSRNEIASPDWLQGSAGFTAVFDTAGVPIASDATLHGALPHPPTGIFDHVRLHGFHKVTWQPQPGIRVALSLQSLPDGRYVAAGQSLTPSETREQSFRRHLLLVWAAMLTVTLVLGVIWRRRVGVAKP